MIFRRQFGSNTRLKNAALPADASRAGADATGDRERFMWRGLSKTFHELWRISGEGRSSYRPDLHYMRGPGPKWRAKYGGLATRTAPAGTASGPVLSEAVEHRA
jgi:hypothetical protein